MRQSNLGHRYKQTQETPTQYIASAFFIDIPDSLLRLAEESDDGAYLCSGEHSGILVIPLGYHGRPHAACEVHLLAEMAQGAIIVVVGVVHLSQLAKIIRFYNKSFS